MQLSSCLGHLSTVCQRSRNPRTLLPTSRSYSPQFDQHGLLPDYYQELNLQQAATAEGMTQQLMNETIRHHPDHVSTAGDITSAAATFGMVQQAWQVLGTPTTRAAYDAMLLQQRVDGHPGSMARRLQSLWDVRGHPKVIHKHSRGSGGPRGPRGPSGGDRWGEGPGDSGAWDVWAWVSFLCLAILLQGAVKLAAAAVFAVNLAMLQDRQRGPTLSTCTVQLQPDGRRAQYILLARVLGLLPWRSEHIVEQQMTLSSS